MKIELVITVWEDGLFRLRDRIETDDLDSLDKQFQIVLDGINNKLAEQYRKKYAIAEDDDIPF